MPSRSRFADAVAAALHREFGDSHGAVKSVMRVTGVAEKTAKNWFQAKNGPMANRWLASVGTQTRCSKQYCFSLDATNNSKSRSWVR
jgi:hypothetical protein